MKVESKLTDQKSVKSNPTSYLIREQIVSNVSKLLEDIINENKERLELNTLENIEIQKSSPFFNIRVSTVTIEAFLERIIKYTKMEESTLVLVLYYIDLLCDTNNFFLNMNNIHR